MLSIKKVIGVRVFLGSITVGADLARYFRLNFKISPGHASVV